MLWAQADHVLAGQESNVFRNKSLLIFPVMKCSFPSISGALSATEILNVIFLSDSCIKLYSLALCTIQRLSTFELNLRSKILFLQFWRLFHLSAVSNTVYKIVQKLLISFLNTFYSWRVCLSICRCTWKTISWAGICSTSDDAVHYYNYKESDCLLISYNFW